MRQVVLAPIREHPDDYNDIEKEINRILLEEFYKPLMETIDEPVKQLVNSKTSDDYIIRAIQSGRIKFHRGTFTGQFSAKVSRALLSLGAKFDGRNGVFRIGLNDLPMEVRSAVFVADSKIVQFIGRIDQKLRQFLPEEIAGKLKAKNLFSSLLDKTNKRIDTSLKPFGVAPKLTAEETEKIAEGYTINLQRYVKDWTSQEILRLRESVQKRVLAGERYESLVKVLQSSYGQSQNKAKFLARQETSLMVAQYKKARYQSAGSTQYKWQCVAGSPAHPVRKWHKALEGKTFSWDDPPNTAKPGKAPNYNNPGEDYNCRCSARVIVRF